MKRKGFGSVPAAAVIDGGRHGGRFRRRNGRGRCKGHDAGRAHHVPEPVEAVPVRVPGGLVARIVINDERCRKKYNNYINEHEKVVKIDSKIYSRGESADSPEGFGFKRTGKIN